MTNLLTNSIKFTSDGRVKFSVTKEREDADVCEIKFIIEDTGIGIEEEVRQRLFRPFSQADSSTARRFGGTGLGLTICKNLVDLMHGRITLESTLGQGTTATFWIPFNKPQYHNGNAALVNIDSLPDRLQSEMSVSCSSSDYDQIVATTSGNSPMDASGRSPFKHRSISMTPPVPAELELPIVERADIQVLVVEDNPINQQIALKTIRKLGFQVAAVWNGKEVLDWIMDSQGPEATKRKPDIILMDVQMPILDGYRATHILRHHSPFIQAARDIPIVAMTASAIQGDREKCKKAGMDDYLAKPVKGKTLEKMLVRWIIQKRTSPTPSGSISGSDDHQSDCEDVGGYAFKNSSQGLGVDTTTVNSILPETQGMPPAFTISRPQLPPRARSHRITLPGPESEGDRVVRRSEAEEKATSLRDEKLIVAAGGASDGILPHLSDHGLTSSQALTRENVGRLEREGLSDKVKEAMRGLESTNADSADSSMVAGWGMAAVSENMSPDPTADLGAEGRRSGESSDSRRPKVSRWRTSERTITKGGF
jgi:CheY-like chemotaxis protein